MTLIVASCCVVAGFCAGLAVSNLARQARTALMRDFEAADIEATP